MASALSGWVCLSCTHQDLHNLDFAIGYAQIAIDHRQPNLSPPDSLGTNKRLDVCGLILVFGRPGWPSTDGDRSPPATPIRQKPPVALDLSVFSVSVVEINPPTLQQADHPDPFL